MSQIVPVIACNCRPVIGHLCLNGRTDHCDALDQDWVLGRPPIVSRACSSAIAIFQLVAGRSSHAAKMHYRSTRCRASRRTRGGIIWMNVAQMNGSGDAAATLDYTSNDFCCCNSQPSHRVAAVSSSCCWIFFATTCTVFKSQHYLGRVSYLCFAQIMSVRFL